MRWVGIDFWYQPVIPHEQRACAASGDTRFWRNREKSFFYLETPMWFFLCYSFLSTQNIFSKKELLWSLWVGSHTGESFANQAWGEGDTSQSLRPSPLPGTFRDKDSFLLFKVLRFFITRAFCRPPVYKATLSRIKCGRGGGLLNWEVEVFQRRIENHEFAAD